MGITERDQLLYDMEIKEKEHEAYFYEQIKKSSWLPFFEFLFSWGRGQSFNDIDIENKKTLEGSKSYCKKKKY